MKKKKLHSKNIASNQKKKTIKHWNWKLLRKKKKFFNKKLKKKKNCMVKILQLNN